MQIPQIFLLVFFQLQVQQFLLFCADFFLSCHMLLLVVFSSKKKELKDCSQVLFLMQQLLINVQLYLPVFTEKVKKKVSTQVVSLGSFFTAMHSWHEDEPKFPVSFWYLVVTCTYCVSIPSDATFKDNLIKFPSFDGVWKRKVRFFCSMKTLGIFQTSLNHQSPPKFNQQINYINTIIELYNLLHECMKLVTIKL